ncbi:hypothetical protein KY284_021293 [Solanum tuberosum]|nr:hypothetical protein KY284_021293 [Solanum tuberosum]
MNKLAGMRYDYTWGVRDYILKMVHIQSKLKALEIIFPDPYIVHSVLNSLPAKFSQMKTAYNTQNESWSISDIISKCVVEEGKKKKGDVALFISHDSKANSSKGPRKFQRSNNHAFKKGPDTNRHGKGQTEYPGANNTAFKKNNNCFFVRNLVTSREIALNFIPG